MSASVQALLTAIEQEDTGAVSTAVSAINSAGETETAVAQLTPLLEDKSKSDNYRRHVVLALRELKSKTAVPALGKAVKEDKDDNVRRMGVRALEQIDPIAGIPHFQVAQRDKLTDIQEIALTGIGVAVQQIVAVLQSNPEAEQETAVRAALQQISSKTFAKLLRLDVAPSATGNASTPESTATALGFLGTSEAIQLLCQFLDEKQQQQARQEQLSTAELDQLAQSQRIEQEQEQEQAEERVMSSAVTALQLIGTPEVIPCLIQVLQKNLNFRVQRLAASALGLFADETAVTALVQALLNESDPKVQSVVHTRLQKQTNWRQKAEKIFVTLQAGNQKRPDIDAPMLIEVINPPEAEQKQLTEFWIAQAVDHAKDDRLTAVLAALIIASANSSMTLAAERIDAYQKSGNVSPNQLQNLRVEVGGSKALDPILGQLEENLKTNFQQPINQLNERTSRVWQQTIRIAQIGFGLRAVMSVVLFCIGAYLVLDSYQSIKAGNLDQAQFLGPGVSFVAGLGAMLTMIFTGPLKEIRKAVGDVGMASAIFIAYIHRILQISHTFSYYYLERKIDFDELDKAGKLIEDTMRDTVELLANADKLPDPEEE